MMQAILGGVLALSVALAWAIGQQHRKALAVTQWQDRTAGGLYMRLPAKWPTRLRWGAGEFRCLATEPKPTLGVTRRIEITQESLRKAPASAQDYAFDIDNRVTPEQTQPLDFLGHKGVLTEVPLEWDEEDGMRQPRPARLFAAVVLPSGTGISVELVGPQIFVAADKQLVEQVAKSLKELSADGHGVAAVGNAD
jgi:hypothetical protein